MLLLTFDSTAPVAWFAVSMCNGENQDFSIVFRVDQTVRKTAQTAAAYLVVQWMPGVGEPADQVDRCHRFQQKGVSQAWRDAVVVGDGIVQFLLSDLEEPDVHATLYFASTS